LNLTLAGQDVKFRNSRIAAQKLVLSITNNLTDTGGGSSNIWEVEDGVELTTKPLVGDLLGTRLRTRAADFVAVSHLWAGEDRGPSPAGFQNNAALGNLVLDGGFDSLFSFTGTGSQNGLYVDYLEFGSGILADYAAYLDIAPNLTIYFAAANVPVEELDGQLNGRLRWVKDFAGPNSSVDVVLGNGQSVKRNRSLVFSLQLDSDGDGTVNGLDDSPFDGVTIAGVTLTNVPPLKAFITWSAASDTIYEVQYSRNLSSVTNWQHLVNFTNTLPLTGPVTVEDIVPPAEAFRFYRVLYSP
jgi:hypothetical protein